MKRFCQANLYLNIMNSNVTQNHKQHFFELGQTIFLNLNLLWEHFHKFEFIQYGVPNFNIMQLMNFNA